MASTDPETLLARDRWLRRAARALLGDGHAAEDLSQDAWVVALGRGGSGRDGGAVAPRPWLLGVLRNLRRAHGRSRARETLRTIRAEEGGLAPATDEVVAELTLQRRATQALLELEEPFRTALHLHYVRELSLEQTAHRTGVATSTVHERVRRGLAILRRRLDREYGGDRCAWAVVLSPLAPPLPPAGAGLAAGLAGGLVVGTTLKAAASIAAIATIAWLWSESAEDASPLRPDAAAPPAVAAAEPEALQPTRLGAEASQRTPVAPSLEAPVVSEAASQDSGLRRVVGRVIDTSCAPRAGVTVGLASGTEPTVAAGEHDAPLEARGASDDPRRRATTGPDGRFELLVASGAGPTSLRCLDPAFVCVARRLEPEGEALLVVARRASFAGQVVDDAGEGIANVRLRFGVRQSLFRRLGIERPFAGPSPEHASLSGPGGEFSIEGVGGGPELALAFEVDGHEPREIELPEQSDRGLWIVLERSEGTRRITGTVVDERGGPVPDARVAAGMEIVRTDASGAFSLSWLLRGSETHVKRDGVWVPERDTSVLWATKAGHAPARAVVTELEPGVPLVLRLGDEPLAIEGRVVDESGAPLAGVLVWEGDPHPFGYESRGSPGATARIRRTLEEMTREGEPGALTGVAGRFRLTGLVADEYELMLQELASATRAGPFPVAAGSSGVELVLPREPQTRRVAGRVVSAAGRSLEGVLVQPSRSSPMGEASQPPWRGDVPLGVRTDDEGRFEFRALATRDTILALQHESFFIRSLALADHEDLGQLEIVQPVLCELQVELADPERADTLLVLDAEGDSLELLESHGAFLSAGHSAGIEQGRSSVLRVLETGVTLVLRHGGTEVARQTLELVPGERTTVRL